VKNFEQNRNDFRRRLADYSNCLKGCPERYLWEPKPHSTYLAAEPFHGSQVYLPNDQRYSLIISYLFNKNIKICGSSQTVTINLQASAATI
jgi:hypothetical protein